ncbi:MAG: hypothetical protein FJY46_07805 [Betaproteobacteria bacterium]|nr:hypothetical protein [Betaproteobacteria bacterium]
MNYKHGRFTRLSMAEASATLTRLRQIEDALILLGELPAKRVGRYPKGYSPIRTADDLNRYFGQNSLI